MKLFAGKGFHGTGIRDLAQEANLSSATLYHYMGTKEDLLADIMRAALTRLITAAREATEGMRDPVGRLGMLVALHVITHAVRPDETRVVDNELGSLSPNAKESVVRLRDEYELLWTETIATGLADGVFETAHPEVTRLALLEMCSGVARWYSPRGSLSLDDLATHYAQLAMRALGRPGPVAGPDLARCAELVTKVWAAAV